MRTRKLLFASSTIAGLLAFANAVAQTTTPPQPPQQQQPQPPQPSGAQPAAPPAAGVVVVTGSRIKRATTFTSPTPIDVVTHDQAELSGQVDITNILQLSAVAESGDQIDNSFGPFVNIPGGPGANTLALRGTFTLGATRTLILLNGERLGPAGVSGQVGPVDLNVIPQSMIDHVEILKDGASSIYGSDAVAGVVNIITKTNENGENVHVFGLAPQRDGGGSWEINGDVGRTWDRGYVTAGFDYFHQDPLTLAERSYLSCSQDLVIDATTRQRADVIDPATGKSKCFNIPFDPSVIDLADGLVFAGAPGSPGNAFTPPGFNFVGGFGFGPQNAIPFNPPDFNLTDAISPLTRYTFTIFAGFDINPHNHLYGSLLLNQRDSEQQAAAEFFTPVDPGNPFNPGFGFPEPVVNELEPLSQTVDYGRIVVGLKGDLPNFLSFTNLQYDIYGQAARSDGWYTNEYEKTDRVNATAGASFGTNGCDVNAIAPFGAGLTMAQAEPGVACVPINYFNAVINQGFTPQEAKFLFSSATGHTTYDHDYIEGTLTGDVYQLPAGPLGASLGFQVRREAIDDQPAPDFVNRNVFNQSTTGVTKGNESIEEVFGELQIPVLKNFPLVHSLDVNLSGRVSNYSSFGTDETYKITAKWALTDWFAFRGTWGTAFRAPDLFELFLGNQIGFLNQLGTDPCVNYLTSGVSQTVIKNCEAPIPLNDGGIPATYSGQASSVTVLSGGGAAFHLQPETARTETVGFVFTPRLWGQSLDFALDWYSFDIKNEITQFGAANILLECYQSPNFPNNPFCKLFNRFPLGQGNDFGVQTVNNDFVNIARLTDQGADMSISYRTSLPWETKLTVTSELDWTFYTNQVFLGGVINNFLGSFGQPKFVGNLDARFDHGPWTFNWYLNMVGPVSDLRFINPVRFDYNGSGETVVDAFVSEGFYTTSNISIQRRFDRFTATLGVNNLFDQRPPLYSNTGFENRYGNTPLATQYDFIGRAFFVSLDGKF